MGYIGVLVLYGYFIISTIINKFLMGPVISYVVEQESREGDFRQVMSVVCLYQESIIIIIWTPGLHGITYCNIITLGFIMYMSVPMRSQ